MKERAPLTRRQRLTRWIIVLVAAPLLLEGGVRLRGYWKYGSNHDVFDLYERDPATGLRVPIPGLSMTLAKTSRITINSRGFRGPEFAHPKAPRTVRMAFFGASPVFCVEVADNTEAWPHLVNKKLAERHPDVAFDYLNAAVSAYSMADSHQRWLHHVRQYDPDVVVIYDATRDVTEDTRELAFSAGVEQRREPSWLEQHSLLWHLVQLNLRYRDSQQRGNSTHNKLAVEPRALAVRFAARVEPFVRDAHSVAKCVVLVTFAIRARREHPPALLAENMAHAFLFTPYLDPADILACYDAYNDALRDVAQRTGAVLIEAARVLPGDSEHFVDSVHLSPQGCRAIAEIVANGLAEAPAFAAAVEAARRQVR